MKSWISHSVGWIRCLEKNWIGFVAWTKDWIGSVAWKSYGLDPLHVKGLDLRGVIRLIEKANMFQSINRIPIHKAELDLPLSWLDPLLFGSCLDRALARITLA